MAYESAPGSARTPDELRAYLDVPELTARIMRGCAEELLDDIATYLEVPLPSERDAGVEDVAELDEALFASAFDPAAPTVAVDVMQSFTGSALLGVAAMRPELRKVNVLYAASPAHGLTTLGGGGKPNRLIMTSGIVPLPDGRMAYGRFPHAVDINLLSTNDADLIAACEANGVPTTTSLAAQQSSEDKFRLHELVGRSVRIPDRLAPAFLEAERRPHEVVIKPSQTSQGLGVLLSDPFMPQAHLRKVHEFLEQNGYAPIIEKRIESWPVQHPESGARLDWNVRAIVNDNEPLDMYVRLGVYGEPVNRTHHAEALAIEDFPSYFPDKEVGRQVVKQLWRAAQSVADILPLGYYGLDLTVDTALEPVLFEVNGENSGGLQTLAELATSRGDKLRNAEKILAAWQERLGRHYPVSIAGPLVPLKPSLNSLLSGINMAECQHILEGVAFAKPYDGTTRQSYFQGALVAREAAHYRLKTDKVRSLDRYLIEHFPLELKRAAGRLALDTLEGDAFLKLAESGTELYPNDADWQKTCAKIEASTLHLAALPARCERLLCYDPDTKQLDEIAERVVSRLRTPLALVFDEAERAQLLTAVRFYMCGIPAVAAKLLTSCEQQCDSEASAHDVRLFRTAFLLAAQDFGSARQHIQELERQDAVELSYFVYAGEVSNRLMSSRAGMELLIDLQYRAGASMMELDEVVEHCQAYGVQRGDEYIQGIARYAADTLPVDGDAADRAWLADLLGGLAAGTITLPLLQETQRQQASEVVRFGLILWGVRTGHDQQITALMAGFRRSGRHLEDMDYVAHVASQFSQSRR